MLKLSLLAFFLGASSARQDPFYRRDYKYNYDYDSFYKLHSDPVSSRWNDALITCSNEGSQLFYPSTVEEWNVVKELTIKPDNFSASHILVGIDEEFNVRDPMTLDGSVTPFQFLKFERPSEEGRCVLLEVETGAFSFDTCYLSPGVGRPFVCKKNMPKRSCPTIDTGYVYNEDTYSCYKIHNQKKNWYEAFETCYLEGGMLLVGKDLETRPSNLQRILNLNDGKDYFIGLRRMPATMEVYTITGQNIDDIINMEDPDYYRKSELEDCFAFHGNDDRQSQYRQHSCDDKLRFICEMKASFFDN